MIIAKPRISMALAITNILFWIIENDLSTTWGIQTHYLFRRTCLQTNTSFQKKLWSHDCNVPTAGGLLQMKQESTSSGWGRVCTNHPWFLDLQRRDGASGRRQLGGEIEGRSWQTGRPGSGEIKTSRAQKRFVWWWHSFTRINSYSKTGFFSRNTGFFSKLLFWFKV